MKKIFIYTILIIGGVTIGWYYLPEGAREKASAFIGTIWRGDKKEIREFVGDQLLPQDPKDRRSVLLNTLDKKIAELKKRVAAKAELISGKGPKRTGLDTNDGSAGAIIKEAEDIIKKLGAANTDASIREKVTDKILEIALPKKEVRLTPEQIQEICSAPQNK